MLKALGFILPVLLFVAWLVLHQKQLRRAAAAWSTRKRLPDEDFLNICDIPRELLPTQAALAARRAIASLATVPADTIRPDDSFADDLQQLPFWDSLDWLGFVLEVEKQTDYQMSVAHEGVEKGIRSAGGYRRLNVMHLVRAVVASARARDDSSTSGKA